MSLTNGTPKRSRLSEEQKKLNRKASSAKWRENNSDYGRTWYLNNRDKVITTTRAYTIKRNFGITQLQADEMLAAQNFLCAICGTDTPSTKKGWHIDHDHASGKVRGILCHHCNMVLGFSRDNPATLSAAISYLGISDG